MPCIVILKVIFMIEWFLTIVTYESLSWFFLAKVGWRHVPTTVVTSCDPPIFPDGRHHRRRVWWWTSLLLNRWNSLVCFPYVNLQTFFISENILTLVTLKSGILTGFLVRFTFLSFRGYGLLLQELLSAPHVSLQGWFYLLTTSWPIGQQIGDRLPGDHLVYCTYIRNFGVLASKPVYITLQRHTGRLVLVKCRICTVSCCPVLAMQLSQCFPWKGRNTVHWQHLH